MFAELLGISHLFNTMAFFVSFLEVPATSDENVTLMEKAFNNVPVSLYICVYTKPKIRSTMKGLILYSWWWLECRECWYVPLVENFCLSYSIRFIFNQVYLVNITKNNGTFRLSEIYFFGAFLV